MHQDIYYSDEIQPFCGSGNGDLPGFSVLGFNRNKRGLVTVSQVRWREGVKEEIPNLLTYYAKAQLCLNHTYSMSICPH